MKPRYSDLALQEINNSLEGKSPQEIVSWAFSVAQKPVVTTNFRPYEAAILHLTSSKKKDLKVIWCDTGYNTPETYRHAFQLIDQLHLNLHLYTPKQTSAYRDVFMGVPEIDDPLHKIFTEQVKLEPFRRAMSEHNPDLWFTNLRKGQTTFRDGIGVVSKDAEGVLKVSPFYHASDEALDAYLQANNLPNEFRYFDPTKVLGNRECGLHV